MKVKLFKL